MGKAWNFYRRALNESVATYGESSAELLPALHGMVRAQYLLAGHQGVGGAMPGNMRRERTSPSQSKAVFKRGISLLIAMQQLNRDRLVASREVQAEDLIRMGDWAWWTGNRNFALEFYGDAIKLANGEELNRGPAANAELAGEEDVKNALAPTSGASEENAAEKEIGATESAAEEPLDTLSNDSIAASETSEATQEASGDSVANNPEALANTDSEAGAADTTVSTSDEASEQIAEAEAADGDSATEKFPTFRILEAPVPLPAIQGFDPVLKVKTEPATEADLIVTFTVNANGKVDNLERVQVPESAGPRSPDRVLRRLRRLRFRPVFEAGEPIESEPITWVFGPEHWASPYDSVTEAST